MGTPIIYWSRVIWRRMFFGGAERTLLERIPLVPDLQFAWLPLHCATSWANFLLRVVEPHALGQVGNCLPIHAKHPEVANMFVEKLEVGQTHPFLGARACSARTLTSTMGFEPPSWRAHAAGARPELQKAEDFEPGITSTVAARNCVQSG